MCKKHIVKYAVQNGGTNFQVWAWGKRRGNQKISQNPGGNQSLIHYNQPINFEATLALILNPYQNFFKKY